MGILDKQLKYEKALEYEIFIKEEYGFSKEKIKKANCIFDIGWHVWFFSKWCRSLNSSSDIHYFEPVDLFCDKAKNLLWNDENFYLNRVWIASTTWNWTIFFNNEKTMQSSRFHSFLNLNWIMMDVQFITLRDYLNQCTISSIDIMKMDIEGMEFEVLFSWIHEWNIIQNLIIEIHLIDNEFKKECKSLYPLLNENFKTVELIPSWYTSDVFLVWACK